MVSFLTTPFKIVVKRVSVRVNAEIIVSHILLAWLIVLCFACGPPACQIVLCNNEE